MALAYEGNTDLAFDTEALRTAAGQYQDVANQLRNMAKELDSLIIHMKDSGWTTPAGSAFYEMTQTNWSENIEKYAQLLDTLTNILKNAATEYEALVIDHIQNTWVSNN